jgi:hypothetical protein
MSTGTLSLALLLLATGAAPGDPAGPEVVHLNSRNIEIPIQIKPGQRESLKQLMLCYSADQGATWLQGPWASPDQKSFTFYAPTDGLYWFSIIVKDKQGNQEPASPKLAPPRLRILVDTLPPNLRILTARREGDEIVVSWEIQEDHLDLSSLKLEYRTPDAPSWMWYKADAPQTPTGQARIKFAKPDPVLVRMQVMDQAGNIGSDQKEIPALPSNPDGSQTRLNPVAAPSSIVPVGAPPVSDPPPPEFPDSATTTNNNLAVPTPPAPPLTRVTPAPTPPLAGASVERVPPVRPPEPAPAPPDRSWAPSAGSPPAPTSYGNFGPSAAATHWPPGPTLPLQMTNSPQVTLDYEITKVGPSGVGSVELYLTRDEGQSWEHYADDSDLRPPLTVTLPGDGIFGLRLVVRSRAGLGGRPPRSGDLPQMRIQVDTKPPLVHLEYPQADPQRRDALLLTWTASDDNLSPNPITLEWAERPDGTWNKIVKDYSNTGHYAWVLPRDLPYRVYLRLTVRDLAGNVTVDESRDAVSVDLHEPEAQLKGLLNTNSGPSR